MELSQIFTGSTLKAADLQGREPTVTIATVEAKKFNDGNKIVITFVGKEKAFVCNKTNANRIAFAHGTNTDNWVGKQITLFTDLVDFQGQTVEAIRVRPPAKRDPISTGRPPEYESDRVPQPPMRQASRDPDDEIGF
jgi:hypothetical protein